jgi:hypothetical protein
LGWTLDFMPAAWPIRPVLRERFGAGSSQARESWINATRRASLDRQREAPEPYLIA